MPKKRKRHADRRGSLRELRVQPLTLARHRTKIRQFFAWLELNWKEPLNTAEDVDAGLSEYLEMLWQDYEPEAWAAGALSAIMRLLPRVRRQLTISRFYLANWRRGVRRSRAIPLTP